MDTYLDELDELLLNQLDEGMLLSDLDGFLTGIIVSTRPSGLNTSGVQTLPSSTMQRGFKNFSIW